jgi:aryl-alcohol dehydrogenase-like predicted oxidoreductase
MERRVLGRTGERLSVIGFGGILCSGTTPAESDRLVATAVDAGVNYFDVAPSYGDAETRLGPALAPYRDDVFLACKTGRRDRAGVEEELRASLERLHTEWFDLYQLHGLTTLEEWSRASGPDGALDGVLAAREAGLVRYIGFSAHSEQVALAALEQFPFESILFPTNYLAATVGGFGPRVFAAARARGVGHLALKTLALGLLREGEARRWGKCWYQPLDDPALARLAVRWTLSQGVTAGPTPGHPELFDLAVAAADDLRAPTPEELAPLRAALGDRAPVFSV